MSLINIKNKLAHNEYDDLFFKYYDIDSILKKNNTKHSHHLSKPHIHFPHLFGHHNHKDNHNPDNNNDSIFNLEKQMTKTLDKDFYKDISKMDKFCPKISLSHNKNYYFIHADIPGLKNEDIGIDVLDDEHILTLSFEKKHTEDNKKSKDNKRITTVESSYGKYERSFTIPEDADLESIEANYENGVLEISCKKIKSNTQEIENTE